MTIRVDKSSNEIYSGANENETRFYKIEVDEPTIRIQ